MAQRWEGQRWEAGELLALKMKMPCAEGAGYHFSLEVAKKQVRAGSFCGKSAPPTPTQWGPLPSRTADIISRHRFKPPSSWAPLSHSSHGKLIPGEQRFSLFQSVGESPVFQVQKAKLGAPAVAQRKQT